MKIKVLVVGLVMLVGCGSPVGQLGALQGAVADVSPAAPPTVTVDPKLVKAEADLKVLLVKWQDRLRLGDWKVVAALDMPTEKANDHAGLTIGNVDERTAKIFINPKAIHELERVLVHELLHLNIHHAVKAQSNQVNEQTVRALEDAIFESIEEARKNGKS